MSKTILIDATNSEQTRIAVTVNDKLDDFEIESNKKNSVKGDVYLAKISRVEPSLQAAFVEFGANRNGFLPLTEIHPDYFKIPSADKEEVKKLFDKLKENDETDLTKDKDDHINEDNIEKDNDKNTVIALREIADSAITVDQMKENLIQEYQTVTINDEE